MSHDGYNHEHQSFAGASDSVEDLVAILMLFIIFKLRS